MLVLVLVLVLVLALVRVRMRVFGRVGLCVCVCARACVRVWGSLCLCVRVFVFVFVFVFFLRAGLSSGYVFTTSPWKTRNSDYTVKKVLSGKGSLKIMNAPVFRSSWSRAGVNHFHNNLDFNGHRME